MLRRANLKRSVRPLAGRSHLFFLPGDHPGYFARAQRWESQPRSLRDNLTRCSVRLGDFQQGNELKIAFKRRRLAAQHACAKPVT
jgi:hypothetical protein